MSVGPVVALRADMDALPVEERNDLPFRSQARATWRGEQVPVSHACGHGRPWTANSALVPAAELTLALQGITGSKVDQSDGVTVLSIGMLQSGRRPISCLKAPNWRARCVRSHRTTNAS